MKRLIRLTRDIVPPGLFLLVAILYYLAARELPEGRGEPGPAFFPSLLAAALLLLSLVSVLGAIQKPVAHEPGRSPSFKRPAVAMTLAVGYVLGFERLGFALDTWLLVLSVVFVLVGRRWLWLLVIPPSTTLLIFALFRWGLDVRLPGGLFG